MYRSTTRKLRNKERKVEHKKQKARYLAMKRNAIGPARIAFLIGICEEARRSPVDMRDWPLQARRAQYLRHLRQRFGHAGIGTCFACGRGPRPRHWHHIWPLNAGGTNHLRNRIRVCIECHAQFHSHMVVPYETDDNLYRSARALLKPACDLRPRLIGRNGEIVDVRRVP